MTSRWYKKKQTRTAMVNGAMAEVAQGRSFDSLSLREVTRAAGIAPTTFYRHFRDMEEFGQALIESAEEVIQADTREFRRALLSEGESVRQGIEAIITAMQSNPAAYRILLNLRMGPYPVLRAAARRVLQLLSESLAAALEDLAVQRRRPVAEPVHAAEAVTSLLWGRAGDIMTPLHPSPQAITAELLIAVRLILRGAETPVPTDRLPQSSESERDIA